MAKLSRRVLIAGASAAPLIAIGATAPAAAAPLTTVEDPVLVAVRVWFALDAKHEALVHEWQDLETVLLRNTGSLCVERGLREGRAEARSMRKLSRRQSRLRAKLSRDADAIAAMRATSIQGARAKLELALAIAGPDCDVQSFALIMGAFEELGRMV